MADWLSQASRKHHSPYSYMPCQRFIPCGISINLRFSIVCNNNGHSVLEPCCHEPRPARQSCPPAPAGAPMAQFRGFSISTLCLCPAQPGDRCRQWGHRARWHGTAQHSPAWHGTAQHSTLPSHPGEPPPPLRVTRPIPGSQGGLGAIQRPPRTPYVLGPAPPSGARARGRLRSRPALLLPRSPPRAGEVVSLPPRRRGSRRVKTPSHSPPEPIRQSSLCDHSNSASCLCPLLNLPSSMKVH